MDRRKCFVVDGPFEANHIDLEVESSSEEVRAS